MGFFGKTKGKGIDAYIAEAQTQGIKVVDVRGADEFAEGHIPEAFNVPLDALDDIASIAPDRSETLYVHCLSGMRSSRACSRLKSMGYTNAINIGGIKSYHGPIEH